MWKVEKERASLSVDEIEVSTEPLQGSVVTVGPSDPSDKNKNKPRVLVHAAGPTLFILRTEVTEDNFAK